MKLPANLEGRREYKFLICVFFLLGVFTLIAEVYYWFNPSVDVDRFDVGYVTLLFFYISGLNYQIFNLKGYVWSLKICGVWDPENGAGRDTHICHLPKRHTDDHLCKCGAIWPKKVWMP